MNGHLAFHFHKYPLVRLVGALCRRKWRLNSMIYRGSSSRHGSTCTSSRWPSMRARPSGEPHPWKCPATQTLTPPRPQSGGAIRMHPDESPVLHRGPGMLSRTRQLVLYKKSLGHVGCTWPGGLPRMRCKRCTSSKWGIDQCAQNRGVTTLSHNHAGQIRTNGVVQYCHRCGE